MAAGCVSSATSSTQARSFAFFVGTVVSMVTWGIDLSRFARAVQTCREWDDRFAAPERQRAKRSLRRSQAYAKLAPKAPSQSARSLWSVLPVTFKLGPWVRAQGA